MVLPSPIAKALQLAIAQANNNTKCIVAVLLTMVANDCAGLPISLPLRLLFRWRLRRTSPGQSEVLSLLTGVSPPRGHWKC